MEYFIYHNNYIPIENSAQRRLVYKIQMIDCENNSTSETFFNKKIDMAIETDVKKVSDIAVGETVCVGSKEVQTEKSKF